MLGQRQTYRVGISAFAGTILATGIGYRAIAEPIEAAYTHPQSGTVSGVTFEPPTDDRLDDSAGGATRPAAMKCRQDETSEMPLSALLPERQIGLTSAERPSFFVYVPPTSASEAYFSLKDDNNIEIYNTLVPIAGAGILRVELPASAPALERDRTYRWQLGLLCQPVQTDLPWVEGQVRRIVPEQTRPANFETLPIIEQATWTAEVGLWHDTLTALADRYAEEPEDTVLSQNWTSLLGSAGLSQFTEQPFLLY